LLTEIRLQQFRCYTEYAVQGLTQKTAFLGENGQGKTSLLEAIYFLSRCRSFRTHQTREMIHWGGSTLGVSGDFIQEPVQRLKVEWSVDERILTVNDTTNTSFRDYWGQVLSVVFQNSDRHILQGPAQLRRQWVDGLIASVQPDYLQWIQRAQLLLKQKNAFLRKNPQDRGIWNSLTDQLEDVARRIHEQRVVFTTQSAPVLESTYQNLTGKKETLTMTYEAEIPRQLTRSRDKLWEMERQFGTAQLGPHRDDWKFQLAGQALRNFGSEGQVKSGALVLRLLEVRLMQEQAGRWPLLLIDDALNDLDVGRKEQFWSLVPPEAQQFYATPQLDQLPVSAAFKIINLASLDKP
jgi:DNA replication and repair protein RecF